MFVGALALPCRDRIKYEATAAPGPAWGFGRCFRLGFSRKTTEDTEDMKITFDRAGVERLIAHAKAAPEHSLAFGEKAPALPGLWIVGDEGVYLMSNGKPGLPLDENGKQFMVYADQINPLTMAFDDWWANKRTAFGGDDGADMIPLSEIEQALATYRAGEALQLELTPKAMRWLPM
jgi:Protein of unknown function (DUF3085)